jgi:hypothetical protein
MNAYPMQLDANNVHHVNHGLKDLMDATMSNVYVVLTYAGSVHQHWQYLTIRLIFVMTDHTGESIALTLHRDE